MAIIPQIEDLFPDATSDKSLAEIKELWGDGIIKYNLHEYIETEFQFGEVKILISSDGDV